MHETAPAQVYPLKPGSGTSTVGGLLRVCVPPVTKYDIHHDPEGGNGIVFDSGNVLAAPPTAYIVGLTAQALTLMPVNRNPRQGAKGLIAASAPRNHATTHLHASHHQTHRDTLGPPARHRVIGHSQESGS